MCFAVMANIFLLEDDKILSKGISIALEKDKHTITAVYGYMEALQKYQKQRYDLFLLDINLPDGSGMELCKKIRETSEIPILFLTANDTEQDMLVIASACKNMWVSLGIGVILVFTLSILPQDNIVLSLFPFASPYQMLSAAVENSRTTLFLAVCGIETVVFGITEVLYLKVRRCFE